MSSNFSTAKGKRRMAVALAGTAAIATPMILGSQAADAATATGTSTVTFTAGALSIGTVTNKTITDTVAGTGNGILPEANWQDPSGSGAGYHGSVAVSDLTYTGDWVAEGGATALTNATSAAFTDAANDGVNYLVTVGAGGTTSSTPYTFTSTDSNDSSGGSGTATNGTAKAIGTQGITITFTSGTAYASGYQYLLLVGTESNTAVSVLTSATGAGVTPVGNHNGTAPVFENNSSTITGGGVGATAYGTAVNFLTAPLGTGNGTYKVDPGVQVVSDNNSWAGNYTAGIQYTLSSGP